MSNQQGTQLDLFDEPARKMQAWPLQEEFPLNLKNPNRTVGEVVIKDIENTTECIILTGFTSLSHLIDTFGNKAYPSLNKTRIVLGFEPNLVGRKKYPSANLEIEIKEYWIERGLSILLGGAVLNLIELIRSKKIEFRYYEKLHAKIYVTDQYAILGSSNFSKNGLNYQHEANIRLRKSQLSKQYESVRSIAENYYTLATPYSDKIIDLLMFLVKKVTWKEALARAISEVIEGRWLQDYFKTFNTLQTLDDLWPSQKRGIAQAMSILHSKSNILIADPTGSGKTKFCSALILTLIHWLWEQGNQDRTNSVIICPPTVVENWRKEFRRLGSLQSHSISMGILSVAGRNNQKAFEDIQLSHLLTIDEAHNYLNPSSNRSKALKSSIADFSILATATPINKRAEDILRLIELLDVDNLSDEDFRIYKELREGRRKNYSEDTINKLREFISQFTIRRTKTELNKEIDREPEKYLNRLGNPCRFPKQNNLTYGTGETIEDIEIVEKISELATGLNGIIYLKNFNKPDGIELKTSEDERNYIENRFKAARALTVYNLRASLRSSHVALLEHIEGSAKAKEFFDFKSPKNNTGNVLKKLNEYKESLPVIKLNKKNFPEWFLDKTLWRDKCLSEINIYREISELGKKLSGSRELEKIKFLLKLHSNHDLLIAFDSTIITLDYLKKLSKELNPNVEIIVVTGANEKAVNKALEKFRLGSDAKCIALCSDKMSEGVNLQQGSAVVLLDMPSVLRIVEQRIGRIDRMDSPHSEIEIRWADDSEAYALRSDKRLIDTSQFVEKLIGSNLHIPKNLQSKHFTNLASTSEMIEEYKTYVTHDKEWEGIQNSYKYVTDLKEDNVGLISNIEYEQMKDVKTNIRTGVSFVLSSNPWCFIVIRGTKKNGPKWYLLDDKGNLYSEFKDISKKLHEYLVAVEDQDWNQDHLNNFINQINSKEKELLPEKRKRALKVAQSIFEKKIKDSNLARNERILFKKIIGLIKGNSGTQNVDYYQYSEFFVKKFQPLIDAKRESARKRVYNLNILTKKMEYNKITWETDELNKLVDDCPYKEDVDASIAACIVGVPAKS